MSRWSIRVKLVQWSKQSRTQFTHRLGRKNRCQKSLAVPVDFGIILDLRGIEFIKTGGRTYLDRGMNDRLPVPWISGNRVVHEAAVENLGVKFRIINLIR